MRFWTLSPLLFIACAGQPQRPGSRHSPEELYFRTETGLRVLLSPRPEAQALKLRLMLPAGAACEHPQERGAALLRLSQLRGDLNAGLTREIALLGGELKAWLEPEFAVYQLRLPQEKLEPALEALKVQLLTPLDPQQLLRLRPALDAQQAALRKDPRRGELEALLAALLPEHPLGRPLLPSSAELTRLNLKRIESFRLRCETPQGSLMSLSGALKPKELLDILERTFTLWRGPSRPRLPPLKLSPPSLELHALLNSSWPHCSPSWSLRSCWGWTSWRFSSRPVLGCEPTQFL